METTKKYQLPDLSGESGNAYAIMALVKNSLEKENCKFRVRSYLEDAMKSNYEHLVGVSYLTLEWLNHRIEREAKKEKVSSKK